MVESVWCGQVWAVILLTPLSSCANPIEVRKPCEYMLRTRSICAAGCRLLQNTCFIEQNILRMKMKLMWSISVGSLR